MIYNPFISPYTGYQNPYGQIAQQQTPGPQGNVLPPQQVVQATGKASIDALRMAPNSSVLILDTTAPVVWLCTTDGLGNVSAKPYDIKEHRDPEPAATEGLEARLAAVEDAVRSILEKREETKDGKQPDAGGA